MNKEKINLTEIFANSGETAKESNKKIANDIFKNAMILVYPEYLAELEKRVVERMEGKGFDMSSYKFGGIEKPTDISAKLKLYVDTLSEGYTTTAALINDFANTLLAMYKANKGNRSVAFNASLTANTEFINSTLGDELYITEDDLFAEVARRYEAILDKRAQNKQARNNKFAQYIG